MNDWGERITAGRFLDQVGTLPGLLQPGVDRYLSAMPESGPGARPVCAPFLAASSGSGYAEYVRPATTGTVRLLINGRSSGGGGGDVDRTEPLEEMERAVKNLGRDDFAYLSAWFFEPATPLRTGPYRGVADWGGLFAKKAEEGVRIRILINDFDPVSGLDGWLRSNSLAPLRSVVAALPAASRDHLKYLVSRHPAHIGTLKSSLAGLSGPVYIASHHQKFLVTRRGDATVAFCGGLDIESRKTPAQWSYRGLIGWHDVHLRLEGPIAQDLEREFVMRWNRERGAARNTALSGWRPFETLAPSPLSPSDRAHRPHRVQTTRTISSDAALSPFSNEREDVWQSYLRIIGCARTYLYLENQYFRSTALADEIVRQGGAVPDLKVILVVVESAAADDGANPLTAHGNYLQYETFHRIMTGLGPARVRLYTMFGRAVHSKLILADDRLASIGSANANVRSFQLDSELNITIDDETFVRDARVELWSFALGVVPATVGSWGAPSFLTEWDTIARRNDGLRSSPERMQGEGVVPFDYTRVRGARDRRVPDYLVQLDLGPEKNTFAGRVVTGPPGRRLG